MNIKELFKRPTLFKTIAVLIPLLFVSSIILKRYIEIFRIGDLRWIYQYGSFISLAIFFGVLPISLLNAILLYFEKNIKNKIIFLLINLLPLLYFILGMAKVFFEI
ncbi:hypothetical protein [Cloacibacterium caeni]|jgi:hypothetical protein|uniref:hypothetical protein n=1 Tax=Cloacibacterium caeni TaxID=2004710 RepID=UPI001BD0C4C2|nr:hypothetical protein [Cloacibacterium caeni]